LQLAASSGRTGVLYTPLATLGWDDVIRFRGVVQVEYAGAQRPAADWLSPTGRPRKPRCAPPIFAAIGGAVRGRAPSACAAQARCTMMRPVPAAAETCFAVKDPS